MTIKYVKGDVVKALASSQISGLLHVCNCQGVMGAGIAKQIKTTFPEAYDKYRANYDYGEAKLGLVIPAWLEDWEDPRVVWNMLAQEHYGTDKRQLSYGALSQCLSKIADRMTDLSYYGIPYKTGCDRAGGDWEVVSDMIKFYLGDKNIRIYKL